MKRLISFSILLVAFTCGLFAIPTQIDMTKLPEIKQPTPLSFTFIPVSASISETSLSVYFERLVGNAVITVYDANNTIVSQDTVDTYSTSELFISTDSWISGNYTLKITYGTTILSGTFAVE
jgi:hypothetical protein